MDDLTIIVPAHNEAAVVGRLLDALGGLPATIQLLVVANGCSDATADVARTHALKPVVLETAEGSKTAALNAGLAFARKEVAVIDADVVISASGVLHLLSLARARAAPTLVMPTALYDLRASSILARTYMTTWLYLMSRRGIAVGPGVYLMNAAAVEEVGAFPQLIADDMLVREKFADRTMRVQDVQSVVQGPDNMRDLFVQRVRLHRGLLQLRNSSRAPKRAPRPKSESGPPGVPLTLPGAVGIPLYVAVTLVVREIALRQERRGSRPRWRRTAVR